MAAEGVEPTVTDANVVLGRLGVEHPLGGEIMLDRGAALAAVGEARGAELVLRQMAMAEGILRIAAVSLAGAIKEVSVMRGIDPRDFALLAFGGAGPLHAAAIADELGMRTVVVPPLPGNFSALGLLIADVRRDFVRTRVSATANTSVADVHAALHELPARRRGRAGCGRLPACPAALRGQPRHALRRSVVRALRPRCDGCRQYRSTSSARSPKSTRRATELRPAAAVEIVSYRLAAWGLTDKPQLPAVDPAGRSMEVAVSGTRAVVFGGSGHQVTVFDRDRLPPGARRCRVPR